ncbi:hypothetical protein V3C99_012704 [Haemonchus contortus]|uniref:Uncharacterized protein n=1 Tax=Haemonchus contortus TaxID=6289 RepID=A0A7I4Z6V3_HAECO
MGEREVDLPQLFNDVSRTISGISNIMGAVPSKDPSNPSAQHGDKSSVVSNLFGNTCFKTCGMEDIQYAARSAGDMLISLRICVVATTVVLLLCMITLTGAVLYVIWRKPSSSRFPLPAFVRDRFQARTDISKEPSSS